MRHIKTPVKLSEWGDLIAGGELLAQGFGPRRVEEMCEIRDALNERAALLKLREACEAIVAAADKYIDINLDTSAAEFLGDAAEAAAMARAALALVRES